MAGIDPLHRFTQHSPDAHLEVHRVLSEHGHAAVWGFPAHPPT